ncbi:MAG: efflux RND transporter periplasmic adaptor subunit [Chloroflexota bacterium]|nr:efflux RND transporter periplasmic adaptor subunit [Chloroflexota bacterium]
MKTYKNLLILGILFLLTFSATACDATGEEAVQASGVVEAIEVIVAPEVGGRLEEISVREGDSVQKGDPLFSVKNESLEAQHQQALAAYESALAGIETAQAALETAAASVEGARAGTDSAQAAVEAAEAGLETAQAGLAQAQVQYDIQLMTARIEDLPNRIQAWNQDVPAEFEQPVWYFQKEEIFEAADAQIEAALESLEKARDNYAVVIANSGNDDLVNAENRLKEAQVAFLIADELRDREIDQNGKDSIDDYVQTIYDAAEAELEAAQTEFEQLLSDANEENILEARARLAASKERYEIAVDYYNSLLTGEYSLAMEAAETSLTQAEAIVRQAEAGLSQTEAGITLVEANLAIAESNVAQAKAGVVQAEKMVAQAEAALSLVEIQLEKLTITAPVSGVIMIRNIEPGELVAPGQSVMTIGQLDELRVTVYIPENIYGQVSVGDSAKLSVDSFPDEEFEATVLRISDEAEYTPRNVQTKEDRSTTVYAIELSVTDPDAKLKPGMPTDVIFTK